MAQMMPASLVLVGAGKMGGSMLDGWIKAGLDPDNVTVLDPQPSRDIMTFARANNVKLNPSLKDVEPPQVLVLAIKPQVLESAAPLLSKLIGPGTVLLSILAGKTIKNMKEQIKGVRGIVRAMPNLPVSVGRGLTAAIASPDVFPYQHNLINSLLTTVGTVEWLTDETLIDAVTAVSGSGPAYVFYLTECMSRAGQAAGLPVELAERLAHATVTGSAELMYQSDLPPAKLRQNVTSPGGTTAAALEVLGGGGERPGLDTLMRDTIMAAARRAGELSG
jgi:pyrroline-5-carboxylate reductase